MPQKPSTRNYESNGPDVKIRGTAAQIAERYRSLARDAFASGDMVTAESYLQHAEHYNRIIMAAPSQMGAHNNYQGEGPNRGDGFRDRGDGGRNVPGGEREHGHPERGNGTGSRDGKRSEQAEDEDAADEVG
jgi:Domain of unknown function (DUF4167)